MDDIKIKIVDDVKDGILIHPIFLGRHNVVLLPFQKYEKYVCTKCFDSFLPDFDEKGEMKDIPGQYINLCPYCRK